jgi:hypothetical protein
MNVSKLVITWSLAIAASLTAVCEGQVSYPVWTHLKFSSLLWRMDHNSRQTVVQAVIANDLPGKTREQICELFGQPDHIHGTAELYDLEIRYPSAPCMVLELEYLAGAVSGWRIGFDRADQECGFYPNFCITHAPVCWYLQGGRSRFPLLSCVEKSRHEHDRVFFTPSNLHF